LSVSGQLTWQYCILKISVNRVYDDTTSGDNGHAPPKRVTGLTSWSSVLIYLHFVLVLDCSLTYDFTICLNKDVGNLNNTGPRNLYINLYRQEEDVGNLPPTTTDTLLTHCQLQFFNTVPLAVTYNLLR
jgi:hypothetical protein